MKLDSNNSIQKNIQPIIPTMEIADFNNLEKQKIIIYGAGTYGTFLLSYLSMKGLRNNVLCFVVSEREGNPKNILDKPVLLFEDFYVNDDDIIMIIALSQKYVNPVLNKINKLYNCFLFSNNSIEKVKKDILEIHQRFPIKKNKVFFYCYGGMGYRCNCKYIAEKLLKENYPVELVWAVSCKENEQDIPENIRTVLIGTDEYYKELYTSLVVIENDGKDTYTCKRQGQFCINTWHGYGPFKKVNGALPGEERRKMEEYYSYYDLFLTASKFYSQVYRESFGYAGEILECGAPRNDVFFIDSHIKEKIYNAYNIPLSKGIVLYAPTFRYNKDSAFDKYYIDILQVLDAIKKKFHKDYVFMYRFHHQLYKIKKRINYYTDGIDVTLYPDIQELLAAADIVITDYSSLMWDFSLRKRPIFLYQTDLEEYEDERGFYSPVSQWPYPQAHSQDELLKVIENFDNKYYVQKLESFLEQYGSCDDGHASERVVKRIMDKIEEGKEGD